MRNEKGFGVLGIVLILVVVGLVAGTGWFVWQKNDKKMPTSTNTPAPTVPTKTGEKINFANPKKGAHFESSTPAHGSTLAAVPAGVVLDFNFDLVSNSTIQINKDGKDYGTGSTTVDANKLALRRQMAADAPDGVYTVNYNGCWPDRTCHDGSFQFAIDRSLLRTYEDKRGQKALTVKLSQLKFQPMNMRISSGTTVTWVNDDSVEHYVNTDSHPAHSHVPGFNSKALAKGASYSFTFTQAGAYPYHCSDHAADMNGNIVVE
jgi:plastocyanin/methionine-rich copper-binding protein CopC